MFLLQTGVYPLHPWALIILSSPGAIHDLKNINNKNTYGYKQYI